MARIFRVYDGDVKQVAETVSPENGKTFKLKELYSHTKSSIVEFIYFDDFIMVIDEEGKLNNKPINDIATYHFRKHTKQHDIIVGDVLICDREEIA
jgi:hypothetical protein